jgi:hypothetical protein
MFPSISLLTLLAEIAEDDESIVPPAPEGGPLSDHTILDVASKDRPDSRPVPKAPNAEPPQNNPAVGTTHLNNPAKGEYVLARHVITANPSLFRYPKDSAKGQPVRQGLQQGRTFGRRNHLRDRQWCIAPLKGKKRQSSMNNPSIKSPCITT